MTATITRPHPTVLSGRQRAILRAVAAGRAELGAGCEPTLYVDGLPCCDSGAAAQLIHAGLLEPPAGPRTPAEPTPAGLAALWAA